MAPSFLDDLSSRLRAWGDALWETTGDGAGGFRGGPETPVNLMSTTDLAWIGYALGLDDVGGPRRAAWVAWLQGRQDPQTGRFEYEAHAKPRHSSGHALWHTVRALNILGGDLAHWPHYLRPVTSPAGLERWFDAVDWAGPRSNHHEVLGLVPILVNLADKAWTDLFYRKLSEQQDPYAGTWPCAGPPNISRTYAYTVLHVAVGRMPQGPERIVDAMLRLQQPTGFWDRGPGFLTMDAAFLLVRLPKRLGHREREAASALERLAGAVERLLAGAPGWFEGNTHGTLALVETLALLQEAMPGRYPSVRPWRFDWDVPAMYRSARVAAGP